MEYTLIVAAICVVIYVTAKLLIDEIDEIDVLESIGAFN
jgi:Flp pilus assembly pilin Flp